MESAMKQSSDVMSEERTYDVSQLSLKAFGREPVRVAFPGGTTRSAFIADMGDDNGIWVFADRGSVEDAQREGIALRTLGKEGSVPHLRGVYGSWVVQEFVDGIRLPIALNEASSDEEREVLIDLSLASLWDIHERAAAVNLGARVPKVGTVEKWLWDRTGCAKRISKSAKISEPKLDREKLVKLMDVKRDEFVKWDARPGNALINNDQCIWFDWEECSRSKALDDLGFVLCDEWTDLTPEAEHRLMIKYFDRFNRSLSLGQGEHYLRLFGVTHSLLRLRRALKLHNRKNQWWDRDYCIQNDKVGVTAQECSRVINRIRRWSDGVEEFASLSVWTEQVANVYDLKITYKN